MRMKPTLEFADAEAIAAAGVALMDTREAG